MRLREKVMQTETERENVRERERERERAMLFGREERKKSEFLENSSSRDQLLLSTSICGLIELKFCMKVNDT
jgi:hypothetical protein